MALSSCLKGICNKIPYNSATLHHMRNVHYPSSPYPPTPVFPSNLLFTSYSHRHLNTAFSAMDNNQFTVLAFLHRKS